MFLKEMQEDASQFLDKNTYPKVKSKSYKHLGDPENVLLHTSLLHFLFNPE